MQFNRVDQVAAWRLCMGCGACASVCPEKNIDLVNIVDKGYRPVLRTEDCQHCGTCIKVCPGIDIQAPFVSEKSIPDLRQAWGGVLEIWEGYAADPEIRYKGSSGGVTTALALYCVEKEAFSGVLHVGYDAANPLQNIPFFSQNRQTLVLYAGSRYAPAAPCKEFNWIQETASPCVFIGKPCDVVALRKAQNIQSKLNDKVGLAISIFCAGTPTTQGTLEILNSLDVRPEEVEELRYRGCGWPGATSVRLKHKNCNPLEMTYKESWGSILSHYGQFRCRLCPESTGESADIACGDPWYREIKPEEAGQSLVLVRSEKGRNYLKKAAEAGYILITQVDPQALPLSQPSLLERRRSLFGRLFMLKLAGVPTPFYRGFHFFRNWLDLGFKEKLRSLAGTLKRIIVRGWIRPEKDMDA